MDNVKDIIPGYLITAEKRHELFGRVSGGSGSMGPENYQRRKVVEETGLDCPKTTHRINTETLAMFNVAHPNVYEDGFEYTEDFDGVSYVPEYDYYIYYNFKCVCGAGGTQTRTLREVYHFVKAQLEVLFRDERVLYFVNILDGDQAELHMDKFRYLLSDPQYEDVRDNIYVGDLKGFFDWFNQHFAYEECQEPLCTQVQTEFASLRI